MFDKFIDSGELLIKSFHGILTHQKKIECVFIGTNDGHIEREVGYLFALFNDHIKGLNSMLRVKLKKTRCSRNLKGRLKEKSSKLIKNLRHPSFQTLQYHLPNQDMSSNCIIWKRQ